ncbi:MAG: hypothetical protein ACR2MX_09185, partial [Cyclobacteriaceae bacterium]
MLKTVLLCDTQHFYLKTNARDVILVQLLYYHERWIMPDLRLGLHFTGESGDLEILVVNQTGTRISSTPFTYCNDSTTGNWLKVALAGVEAETHGIGSRIKVVAGERSMIREVDGGGS